MSQGRIDALRAMSEVQPEEPMVWYGLANEYAKLAQWEAAAGALRRVVQLNPDYTSAYQLLGAALANLGRNEEARRAWQEGVETADRTGAWKARRHMENLLAGASDEGERSDFCAG